VTLPTRRAALLLAAVAPVGLLGYLSPAALDAVLLLDALLALLVLVDARMAADPHVLVVAREAPAAFSRARPAEVGYRWRNPAGRPARLVVREARPAILGAPPAPRALAVPARGATAERFRLTPPQRGAGTGGWLAVRSVGPLGLGQRQARLDLPWDVMVFPTLPETRLKASVAAAVRRREAGFSAQRQRGEGRVFESLREWVPGDDTRIIDWKATARRRKLIARAYEVERRQHVLLLLDAGRLLTAEVAGTPRLEYAVDAAVSLALAAVHHDDDVGILVFADTVLHYVAPQRGRFPVPERPQPPPRPRGPVHRRHRPRSVRRPRGQRRHAAAPPPAARRHAARSRARRRRPRPPPRRTAGVPQGGGRGAAARP